MMDESRIRNLRYQVSEKMPLSYSDLLLLLDLANAQAAEIERLRGAAEKERAAIVAWLLECMKLYISRGLDTYVAIEDIAHNIERGEHHGAPPE